MPYGTGGNPHWGDEEETVRIESNEHNNARRSTLCLIGKILTDKSLNAYGFLETMKKATKPTNGFIAKETDLREVLAREPWHFDKHLLVLKELDMGEQPSTAQLHHTPFWVRLYDLPMVARTLANTSLIAQKCGEVLEVDKASVDGFSRSVRARVKVDLLKPVKRGTKLEISNNSVWVPFKYERLPSFCYICRMMGHMKRECDLPEEGSDIVTLTEDKLPFGEWMRVSPTKKVSVATEARKTNKNELDEDDEVWDSDSKESGHTIGIEEASSGVKRVTVGESPQIGGEHTPQKTQGEWEQSKPRKMKSQTHCPNLYTKPTLNIITHQPPTTPHSPLTTETQPQNIILTPTTELITLCQPICPTQQKSTPTIIDHTNNTHHPTPHTQPTTTTHIEVEHNTSTTKSGHKLKITRRDQHGYSETKYRLPQLARKRKEMDRMTEEGREKRVKIEETENNLKHGSSTAEAALQSR
ncbi:hypothetical protein ACS0TY_007939 [Phlomoides rotata]